MNKVMLIGNVGKDPEVRYFEADQAVAQLTLATTERGYMLQIIIMSISKETLVTPRGLIL